MYFPPQICFERKYLRRWAVPKTHTVSYVTQILTAGFHSRSRLAGRLEHRG
jgi:hypothetical protein